MIDFYDLTIFAAVLAVVELIGILLAVDAVMRPRSSQAAIAWSIALIALPFITIPLYVIFGRTRFRGYQTTLQEKEALVGEQLADWFVRMSATAAEPQEGLEAVEDLVKGLTQIPFTRGNHVALLVDDRLAEVGTVNLDNRALYLNFEATALVADVRFANRVEAMLKADLEHCESVDRAHFDDKPLRFRIAARIARLASPLL